MAKRRSANIKVRTRVLKIVGSFGEATATPVLTHLKLEVRKKKFGWYMDNHHEDGRLQINCRGKPGRSQELAATDPDVFFVPSYQGKLGNIGIWLDVPGVDWAVVSEVLFEAYALAATDIVITRTLAVTKRTRKAK